MEHGEYIEKANKNIEKLLKNISGKHITIIDCYNATQYKEVDKILDKHKFVLNTSGIKEIEEVFKDYKKRDIIA